MCNRKERVAVLPGLRSVSFRYDHLVSLVSCRLLSPVATIQGLWGYPLLLDEHVNQRLHRLHLLVRDELVILGDSDKVHEAHVQDVVLVEVPEGVQPVCVVEMRIAAEHLLHNTLAVLVECLGKATGLANPLVCRCAGRSRWAGGLRGSGGGCSRRGTVGISHRGGFRGAVHLLRGEHDGVMDLADNPLLDAIDEFRGGDLGCTAVDEPSIGQPVGVIAVSSQLLRIISTSSNPRTDQPTSSGMCSHCKSEHLLRCSSPG